MNYCSYFIKDKCMFGSFPTQESVNELEHEGVRYFIDLTYNEKENKITSYTTKYTYINYPIKDNYVPIDLTTFTVFIVKIAKIIKNLTQEKVYIHCKGGHGRSGVVVSCLLCYIFKLTPYESLEYTTKCHNNRNSMRDKWRKIGSPQTYLQKKFVYKFFEPLKIYQTHKNSIYLGFSNLSNHPINFDENTIFETSEIAISNLIEKFKDISFENIDKEKINIIFNILEKKFNQYEIIRKNLINTGLRPLLYYSFKKDDTDEKNIFGKILMKLRNKYYEKI